MPDLTLVGTVHLDPDGYRLLRRLLEELDPQTITVDVSPYALEFRRETGPGLLERLNAYWRTDNSLPTGLEAVAAQLEIPFEYRAAEDYARGSGARLVAVGDSSRSRELLGLVEEELLNPENLAALAAREGPRLEEQVAREWQRARAGAAKPPPDTASQKALAVQDERLAGLIREYAPQGALVHIGGWEHLWKLSELLANLRPFFTLLYTTK